MYTSSFTKLTGFTCAHAAYTPEFALVLQGLFKCPCCRKLLHASSGTYCVYFQVSMLQSSCHPCATCASLPQLYQLMHAAGLLTCYRTHKPACLLRWGLCGDFKFCDETSLFKKPAAYCICAYFSSVNAAELMPPMCTCASLPQTCGSICGTWSYVTSAALQLQSTCILCQMTHAASFGNITGSLSLHVCYTLGSMWVLQDLC